MSSFKIICLQCGSEKVSVVQVTNNRDDEIIYKFKCYECGNEEEI